MNVALNVCYLISYDYRCLMEEKVAACIIVHSDTNKLTISTLICAVFRVILHAGTLKLFSI